MTPNNSPLRLELKVSDIVPFGNANIGNVIDRRTAFYALTLELPKPYSEHAAAWNNWKAGQFVMIRPTDWSDEVLWARPFSIARVTNQGLVLFFQTVGKGTNLLSKLQPGDKVVVWGPLGTSFAIEENTPTLLLAGGIGLIPFCGYLDQHPRPANLHMMFGHRLDQAYYPLETVAQHIEVETYHEQCDKDREIFLADLETRMLEYAKDDGLVLACGPMPFLEYIAKVSKKHSIRTQLSLENKMACGIGACLGCVAKTSNEWPDKMKAGLPVQTCTKGPVFWAHHLDI